MRRFAVAAIGAVVLVGPASQATARAGASSSPLATAHTPLASWPVVGPGQSGIRVRSIQYLLDARGAKVVVDGKFGKSTTTAVKSFQRAQGLKVDGKVGVSTWPQLVLPLKQGSRGDAVRAAQYPLRFRFGLESGSVDGKFGTATQKAVKAFQTQEKLPSDGIVGQTTWRALMS